MNIDFLLRKAHFQSSVKFFRYDLRVVNVGSDCIEKRANFVFESGILTNFKVICYFSFCLELLFVAILEKHCKVIMESLQNRDIEHILRDLGKFY